MTDRRAKTILDIAAPEPTRVIPIQITPEIPEPIEYAHMVTDDTNQIAAPTFDWSHHEQVQYQLSVRLTDLQAWLGLREKYGTANNLIALINSDRVILGQDSRPFPYIAEF